MTTAEFIKKTYNTTSTRERRCSSVFTDEDGVVYSYGYHYPLAFNVAGMDFINNMGYSITTAKHISWAQSAIGHGDYINVKLERLDTQDLRWADTDSEKLEVIERALARELKSIMDKMDSKKSKDTQVYRDLKNKHEKVYNSLTQVMEHNVPFDVEHFESGTTRGQVV